MKLSKIGIALWLVLAAGAVISLSFHAAPIIVCLVAWCGGVVSHVLYRQFFRDHH